jgi:hypothetical protein
MLAERLLTFADFSRKARRGLASMEPEVQTTRPFEFLRV